MASSLTYFLSLILLSAFSIFITGVNSDWYSQPEVVVEKKEEKVTNIHFYFHDTISGGKPSAIQIAGPKDEGFGTMMMADEPLTEGPELTSKLIGKAQGVYAVADQQELGFLMVFTYAFVEGKYNGSTLSALGRNPIFHPVRELSIVGGTGLFQFARGYAQAKTYSFNNKGDAIVEYNLTVVHY